MKNPIVEEIHRIRAEMLSEHGGDFSSLMKHLQRSTEPDVTERTVTAISPNATAAMLCAKTVG